MKISEKELQELRNKALSCDSRGAAITISARLLITLIDEHVATQQSAEADLPSATMCKCGAG